MQLEIKLTFDTATGNLNVSADGGLLAEKLRLLGMIEIARDVIKNYKPPEVGGVLLARGADLPPPNGKH